MWITTVYVSGGKKIPLTSADRYLGAASCCEVLKDDGQLATSRELQTETHIKTLLMTNDILSLCMSTKIENRLLHSVCTHPKTSSRQLTAWWLFHLCDGRAASYVLCHIYWLEFVLWCFTVIVWWPSDDIYISIMLETSHDAGKSSWRHLMEQQCMDLLLLCWGKIFKINNLNTPTLYLKEI